MWYNRFRNYTAVGWFQKAWGCSKGTHDTCGRAGAQVYSQKLRLSRFDKKQKKTPGSHRFAQEPGTELLEDDARRKTVSGGWCSAVLESKPTVAKQVEPSKEGGVRRPSTPGFGVNSPELKPSSF